jgi:hypothetical protein
MRNFVSAILAVSLISTSMAWAGETLAAGKPAGVQKAQAFGTTELLLGAAVVGLAVGIGIATSGGRASALNQGQPIVTQATSST